ncbi:hypothetical protein Syncc8109_0713 [Synechococcus sp. WH 8109]|uniref:type IV pilus biogenesis protein EbsA n=1 Tax=Synechococcus sp. WH 8109 TaxID=166314 RepID=UPI0003DFE97F|nr:type IV pilus biogenesis protein EbsA [Synechococcus sp. WH 8109]AHF63093.1 hypothetical protein Syncc8109_0713 [Synechococcus sp. WH 8109]
MPPNWFCSLSTAVRGALQGRRPVSGSHGHLYELRWNEVAAAMERLDCQLGFPCHPEVDLDLAVTPHQLGVWLMDCSHLQPTETDLPNGFWQWLLIERGDAPEQA